MVRPKLSPEFRLLAAATRRPLTKAALSPLLTPQIDWALFLNLAQRHRVLGLVADTFESVDLACDGLLPNGVRQSFAQARRASVLKEMQMLSALKQLTDAMARVGVIPILLKGLHVSARGYGVLGLRTNFDIDILVDEEDLGRASSCLLELGYKTNTTDTPSRGANEEAPKWTEKDVAFFQPSSGVAIDLHWRLFHNPHLMPLSAGHVREETLFNGISLRVLTPPANIVYLAAHGAIHAWSRLKWLADFQALLAKETPETIEAAQRLAYSLGLSAALEQALAVRSAIYDSDIVEGRPHGWRASALTWMAILTMSRWGAREIEQVRGATKVKNASHYLLRMAPSYLLFEVRYDISARLGSILSALGSLRPRHLRIPSPPLLPNSP